jgi:septal ring factor EnvC (AmiA/AmiB activator)
VPPAVKSLDQRLDGVAEELESLQAQLSAVAAKLETLATGLGATQAQLATVSAQLAVIAAKLDNVSEQLKATNTRLEGATAKQEGLLTAHATLEAKLEAAETRSRENAVTVATLSDSQSAFKAKAETTFGMLRWAGAFAAATLVTVIFAALTVVRAAGNLEANIQQQQKSIEEIKRDVADIRTKQKP